MVQNNLMTTIFAIWMMEKMPKMDKKFLVYFFSIVDLMKLELIKWVEWMLITKLYFMLVAF